MESKNFQELVDIVRRLRIECPWDREQTHDSIKVNTLEEAYEVVEAIDMKDFEELKKELGDLLLHVVFHSLIAEKENNFKLNDVIDSIKEKLVRRHPHVFGDVQVNGTKEVLVNWEAIKMTEGRENLLEGVPKNLPSLARACRLQEKASKVGFDWEDKKDVWKKVIEEIEELQSIEDSGDQAKIEEEMGDILFALTNYARFLNVNPENALRFTNEKFIKRFTYIEEKLKEQGKKITESNLQEMDKYWEESKLIKNPPSADK
jgi:tetrapyrrole methylase family protein / MazG family protein